MRWALYVVAEESGGCIENGVLIPTHTLIAMKSATVCGGRMPRPVPLLFAGLFSLPRSQSVPGGVAVPLRASTNDPGPVSFSRHAVWCAGV